MVLREVLAGYFGLAVAAASAARVLPPVLPQGRPRGRTIVLGCGKAAAAMAEVAASTLEGEVCGCVVTRYGHGPRQTTGAIEVIEAGHPVPDAASLDAGRRIRAIAASATADDRVIFLVSGGGSALMCDPVPGLSLEEKREITAHLVRSGMAIGDINLVRRHLSQVKGGRLAAAAAAAAGDMHTYLISDVVGDDPAAIASGPSIACRHEPERAIALLAQSGWTVTTALAESIRRAAVIEAPVHPVQIIANGRTALDALTEAARTDGWNVIRPADDLSGDAAEVGRVHAAQVLDLAKRPGCHLFVTGGELTVEVRDRRGRGGPNLEYLTGLMAELPEGAPIAALAADSDGIDGSEDNAGGFFDCATRAATTTCQAALATNDSYGLFKRIGGLIMTGPTRTNVNDIRMIAVITP